MATANEKTQFKQPTTRAELQEMRKKVHESNTYAHSWYVSKAIYMGNIREGYRDKRSIIAANLTKSEALDKMHRLEAKKERHLPEGTYGIYYDVANPFDDYYTWIQNGGADGGKIRRWREIQNIAWNSPNFDEKHWD